MITRSFQTVTETEDFKRKNCLYLCQLWMKLVTQFNLPSDMYAGDTNPRSVFCNLLSIHCFVYQGNLWKSLLHLFLYKVIESTNKTTFPSPSCFETYINYALNNCITHKSLSYSISYYDVKSQRCYKMEYVKHGGFWKTPGNLRFAFL